MEERKFVCKYCYKRYPCGKSLGGHIRTHMNEHSAQDNEEKNNGDTAKFEAVAARKRNRDFGSEAPAAAGGGNPIYGLRENPKKTMRFVHSNTVSHEEKFCKECGKGFSSLKALCGHMACHSEKDKGANSSKFENNSRFSENQKLVMDSQSDTETSAPNLPRRSRRMRFKTINNNPASSTYLANGSSSVSEVDQEGEEVARCLMLLSKDSSYKGRFALLTESSDNNSVVLEAKSPSVDTRITVNNRNNSVSNAYHDLLEKKVHKDTKLKSAEIAASDNSDSGYFKYGPKKVDSDVSIDGVLGNYEFERQTAENGVGFADYDAESRKMLNRCRSRNIEFKKLVRQDLDYDGARWKFDSRKRANNDSLTYNLIGASLKKTSHGFTNDEICENGGKGWKSDCLNSERVNDSYESAYESDEHSNDTDSYPARKPHSSKAFNGKKSSKAKKKLKSKKSREHECPICYKIFRSGQALGGHKRSHFVGGSEGNTLVIKHGSVVVPCLIDLNLPAPVDE